MAVTLGKCIYWLLFLHLYMLVSGKLTVPAIVKIHSGQTAQIICTHTCTGADSCNVRLGLITFPSEVRGFHEFYNFTHHSLVTIVEEANQEVSSTTFITCVAMTTNGDIVEEASTEFKVCPSETLRCELHEESSEAASEYVCACEYKSECNTVLKCEANGELKFLGLREEDSRYESAYRVTSLTPGDNVTCYLNSPSMEKHLQTSFVSMVPVELTTRIPDQKTTTEQPTTPSTCTCPTTPEPTTTAPDLCPVTPYDCTVPWVLFAISAFALIAVVLVVYLLKKLSYWPFHTIL